MRKALFPIPIDYSTPTDDTKAVDDDLKPLSIKAYPLLDFSLLTMRALIPKSPCAGSNLKDKQGVSTWLLAEGKEFKNSDLKDIQKNLSCSLPQVLITDYWSYEERLIELVRDQVITASESDELKQEFSLFGYRSALSLLLDKPTEIDPVAFLKRYIEEQFIKSFFGLEHYSAYAMGVSPDFASYFNRCSVLHPNTPFVQLTIRGWVTHLLMALKYYDIAVATVIYDVLFMAARRLQLDMVELEDIASNINAQRKKIACGYVGVKKFDAVSQEVEKCHQKIFHPSEESESAGLLEQFYQNLNSLFRPIPSTAYRSPHSRDLASNNKGCDERKSDGSTQTTIPVIAATPTVVAIPSKRSLTRQSVRACSKPPKPKSMCDVTWLLFVLKEYQTELNQEIKRWQSSMFRSLTLVDATIQKKQYKLQVVDWLIKLLLLHKISYSSPSKKYVIDYVPKLVIKYVHSYVHTRCTEFGAGFCSRGNNIQEMLQGQADNRKMYYIVY